METKTFKVNGMKCGMCKNSVETALKGVKGVHNATVSLADGSATVEWDENEAKPGDLKEAVDALGSFELEL
jgi:copper chaperone